MEAIVAGLLIGIQNFWLVGGGVYLGARGNGGVGSYRQARHAVGLALVPFIVSLVAVWPVRLAIFGSDLFSSGGSDSGAAGDVFRALDAGFVVWSLALLLVGVRTLNGWSWLRSMAALALAGVFVLLFLALAIVA
jgi:Yip1 domain